MKEDRQIWSEFKNNAEYALSYIYHQNIDFLFCYGKKFTRNEDLILDMIQDLFYELIKSRKNLGETDNIRLYLLKSFRRKLLRGLESQRKLVRLNSDFKQEPQIVFSVEEELITDEEESKRLKLIRQGLQELNTQQREVIYYKYTLGYDYGEICEIMSVTYDSARQLVSRGINSLKKYLSGNDLFLMFIFKRLTSS